MESATKVLVVGGAGQAGKIHVANLQSLGAQCASFDVVDNPNCANFNAKEKKHADVVAEGYEVAICSLPDHMLFAHASSLIEAGFKRIMIEKPGSTNSADLEKLAQKAEAAGVTMYINYQRSFNEKMAKLLADIKEMKAQGYQLDYVSVFSCDKAQPPQAAPQYLNQGCHDYAMLLSIFEAAGTKLKNLQSRGVKWQGTEDTQFFKITGEAQNDAQSALFDVQMGRCNSTGTFTELYVRLSKYDADAKMYTPYENKLTFPEVPDPNATWADVWGSAFVKSAEALYKGENGVPVRFGLNTLKFAEKSGQSYNEGSKVIENDFM